MDHQGSPELFKKTMVELLICSWSDIGQVLLHLFLTSTLEGRSVIKPVSLVAQLVKNLPAIQETQVQSLGQEDPLEKETATHSSILAWRILWTEERVRLLWDCKESDMTVRLKKKKI